MQPNIRDQEIGRRIRSRRRALEISQDALGAAIGVSPQQVAKYESGKNRIAAGCLIDIARTLNTTTGELLGETETKEAHRERSSVRP